MNKDKIVEELLFIADDLHSCDYLEDPDIIESSVYEIYLDLVQLIDKIKDNYNEN